MKSFTVWLLLSVLAGCAGQGGTMAKDEGITTYGVIDMGVTSHSRR
jgi:hypothetical protein